MDFTVSINLPIIKKEHFSPSYIKLFNGKLFQEANVEGSICATIHFECLVGSDTIEHQVALVFEHINVRSMDRWWDFHQGRNCFK
jgi:hypothetical protein